MTGEKRKTSQLSQSIYSDMTNDPTFHKLSRRLEDLRNHSDIFMIVEDASRAFPYSSLDREFRASLRSSDDLGELPERVATAIGHEGRSRGRRTHLSEALRDFAELCIQEVLLTGEAAYEIAYSDPDVEGRWTRFHLVRIHPYRRSLGRHRHYIAGSEDHSGRWITLPGPSVVVFRLEPASCRRAVGDAMSALRSARAWTAFTRMAEQRVPYDIEAHSNSEQELLARVTRGVGWIGRGLYAKKMLDPYRLTRELQFAIFLARLRSMVVNGVQAALDRAGLVLGFTAELEVSGLPTEEDIQLAISTIESGPPPDQSLLDVVKPYLYP
jgi:hypothetical protein